MPAVSLFGPRRVPWTRAVAAGTMQSVGRIRFRGFEVDLATGELLKNGASVRLPPQSFAVLAALLNRPGELVPREELRARLAPADAFGDVDHALNKAVSRLRGALGDEADRPRFVETLAGRGYRFVATVDGNEAARSPRPVARLLYQSRTVWMAVGIHLLGREEGIAVRLDSSTVSRRHAKLVLEAHVSTIEDLGSKNGTRVNDRRIASPTPLNDGDRVQLGSVVLTFRSASGLSTDTLPESSTSI
jgi:DNA-binding winged helix-turn-helix (wHTH) protein